MRIPKAISDLVESFEKLPGIGPKSAQRLTFYLLHVPQSQLEEFGDSLANLKKNTVICEICKNIDTISPCQICLDSARDKTTIMVVEAPLDVLAIEKTSRYQGLYHVLHGAINPLENIGPDEIFIEALFQRVGKINGEPEIQEIIIATNPTMEGEATSMYINKKLQNSKTPKLKVTRLGRGIPTGADLEYADETTLREAIEGRREI
ncbi:MAG: recombination mediator RecR [Patescibacteria group bacterium]